MHEFIVRSIKSTFGLSEHKHGTTSIANTMEAIELIEWLVETTDYEPIDLVFPVEGKGWCIPARFVGYEEPYNTYYRKAESRILEVTDDSLAVYIKLKFGFPEIADLLANKGRLPR